LGFALFKLHRLPAATEELRTAIRLKNDYATAHLYLGFVYIEQKNKPGAQSEYTILRRLDPAKAQQLYDAAPASMRN
jgi:Tfp pilus assembly protein PilF